VRSGGRSLQPLFPIHRAINTEIKKNVDAFR
jgi:hypothetical protein